MHLYYTHDYRSEKGESHRLLAKAVAVCLYASEYGDAAGCEAQNGFICAENDLNSFQDDLHVCDLDERISCMSDDSRVICMNRADELVGRMQRMYPAGNTKQSGKPFIPGFASFSISHSANTWAVLILDDPDPELSCGLDIQYRRKADSAGIASRFFAAEDAEMIASFADRESSDAEFFRIWARREALIKAIGGSVADTDIPAVRGNSAEYRGKYYVIRDVEIPAAAETECGADGVCSGNREVREKSVLSAAICIGYAIEKDSCIK